MEWAKPFGHDWYELFKDMGSLIGVGVALIAGGIAYWAGRVQATATRHAAEMQIEAERDKHAEETETVRKSLAIELRQIVARAYGAHLSLSKLMVLGRGQITAWMVESSAAVPVPIVYPAVAERIGLLKNEAMDVVIVYQLIEVAREGTGRLMRYRTPDDIPLPNVGAVTEAFLQACLYARAVLPRLRTGVRDHDEKDDDLINKINEAASGWQDFKNKTLWSHENPGI